MKITMTAAAFALALTGAAVPAMAQTPPPPPPADAKMMATPYVMAAGASDQFEIQSSQIALQKTQNPAVRKFADMMIKDHMKTTAATTRAATRAGLTPMPPMLDPGAQPSIAELQNASGADFDRLYLGQQVPAHQAALDLHQSYAAGGDKAPLKTSALAAVPIVKRHLAMAQKMMASMGGMNGMSGM